MRREAHEMVHVVRPIVMQGSRSIDQSDIESIARIDAEHGPPRITLIGERAIRSGDVRLTPARLCSRGTPGE